MQKLVRLSPFVQVRSVALCVLRGENESRSTTERTETAEGKQQERSPARARTRACFCSLQEEAQFGDGLHVVGLREEVEQVQFLEAVAGGAKLAEIAGEG